MKGDVHVGELERAADCVTNHIAGALEHVEDARRHGGDGIADRLSSAVTKTHQFIHRTARADPLVRFFSWITMYVSGEREM